MSFRKKAEEIKAQGEATRGDYQPTGLPLRMYDYWARTTPNPVPARENFCHFYRVVLFWAPLWFLAEKIMSKTGLTVIATALVGATAYSATQFPTFLEFLTFMGAGLAGLAVVVAVAIALMYAWDYASADFKDKATDVLLAGIVGLVGLGLLGLLTALTLEFGWVVLVWIAVSVIGAAAFIGLCYVVAVTVEIHVAKRREQHKAARERAWNDYDNGGPHPDTREPGRLSKFFSGMGDLLILVFQAARVKKWKICPTVTIKN